MTSRSGRGRWQRVVQARTPARATLGRGPDGADLYATPPKARTAPAPPPRPVWIEPGPSEGGLFLGEAALRLGVSRQELEAMIAGGLVKARSAGLTRMIPTREVERLITRI